MAGGKGKRLWPCSREGCPKQFLDFFSTGRTLLQYTFDRIARFIPVENILISTIGEYVHMVEEQVPELPKRNILSEPIARNTAPSVAWATHRISLSDPGARIVVVPSDQAVFKEDVFVDNLVRGLDFVGANDCVLSMGVRPTRPEPGYGYIQAGSPTEEDNVFRVKSFTEKPDRAFAQVFMESGEFYWNTGLFLANARHMRNALEKSLPMVLRNIGESGGLQRGIEMELAFIADNYPSYPNLSIDHALLDKGDNVHVMVCDFGWADLGMWHSIYESMSKADGDNVVVGSQVVMEESKNNIIKLPHDHVGVINGLDGYIVAEKGNVLLICRKEDSSALIRKYVNEVEDRFGEDFV